jgi:hypothetical protein
MKQYQLPKEFAEKWVAALRSGEFPQGKGKLLENGTYCCLGVGGKICGATDEMLADAGGFLFRNRSGRKYFSEEVDAAIPDGLREGQGFNLLTDRLYKMNDNGASFPEIADWIEQNVEFT